MRCPPLLKGRSHIRQTANAFAANFRPRGTDLLCSNLSVQLEVLELDPANLTALYHGHLKAC